MSPIIAAALITQEQMSVKGKMQIDPDKPVSEKIIKFLDTSEGRQAFADILGEGTRQRQHEARKSFKNVPLNVRKWLYILNELEKRVE
jgi:hypothetical protein